MSFLTSLSPSVIWIALIIIFAVLEALTMGLTTIWFAGAALIALLAAMFGLSVPVQIGVFLVSAALLDRKSVV